MFFNRETLILFLNYCKEAVGFRTRITLTTDMTRLPLERAEETSPWRFQENSPEAECVWRIDGAIRILFEGYLPFDISQYAVQRLADFEEEIMEQVFSDGTAVKCSCPQLAKDWNVIYICKGRSNLFTFPRSLIERAKRTAQCECDCEHQCEI